MFTQSFYFKLNLTVLKTSFKNFYETYIFVLFDILSSKSFYFRIKLMLFLNLMCLML